MAQHLLDASPPLAILPPVRRWSPEWAIPEVPVPESDTHDAAIEALRGVLQAWVERMGRNIKVARNLGIRWVPEEPRFGFDPDLCLIEPAPDPERPLHSLRLWEADHAPPELAIEVVSHGHPYKDYIDTPERCAASGVRELWVYDPMLVGPRVRGGPHLLQIWQRREDGGFERISAGLDINYSPFLAAWVRPLASTLACDVRVYISDDPTGEGLWLTKEQAARVREQQARAEARLARASERAAIAGEQAAIAGEQAAIASERAARDAERRAIAGERHALTLLQHARRERDELEKRLRQLQENKPRE